ncbi:hypothetical protein SAMN05428944_0830 [Streptomyces sp. 1222.5]|nr:hypothetical protein BX260_7263 [Streptomyces sp. 5112.2]SEB66473.1 hypothetical protein SAMN05428944_0830 [Streptomyces sp. 1222.5]SEE25710.1 hypothetical protein SAMN05216532_7514 [Streptomyces sp. 2231.1]
MLKRTVRLAVFAIVSVLATTTSACSSAKPCAGVGVTSQIGVMFLQRGYTDLAGATYELCAGGRCVRDHLEQEDITHVTLRLPDDVGPDLGTVRFRVTPRGSNHPEIDASSDVELIRRSDGCGGGAYSQGLAFTREGGLTTKIPPGVSAAWHKHIKSLASPSE